MLKMRDRVDEELVSRRLARVLPPAGLVDEPSTAYDDPPPRPNGGLRRFDPGRPGLRALAVVATVVAVAAAFWAWRSRPQVEPVQPVPSSVEAAAPGSTAEIVVSVVGKVRRPGLVRLPTGSRVADAVKAAGGALPDADLSTLNQARKLADGEQIVVGAPAGPGAAAPAGTGAGGLVNLNTASADQLQTLPGVGPVLAERILEYRQRHGFRSVADLREVTGIGEARFAELKDLVTV